MRRLATIAFLFASLLPALPVHAETRVGDLVRSQTVDTVYVVSADGKRYTFFSNPIYHTWYDNFIRVKFISDQELAAIPFGGVMFVRPGTVMVKVPTDPKVYAVASGGVLRPVKDEATAIAIFGPNWNKQIIDLDVAFLAQYFQGAEIRSVDDYVPAYERHLAGESENVLIRPTRPGPTPAPAFSFTKPPATIAINDGYAAQVTAVSSTAGIRQTLIASNGTPFARCEMDVCGGVAGPFTSAGTQKVDAYVCDRNGTCKRTDLGTVSVIVSAGLSGTSVNLSVATTTIARLNQVSITATAINSDTISRIAIVPDTGTAYTCLNTGACTYTTLPLQGPATYTYRAYACDGANRCVFTKPITLTVK